MIRHPLAALLLLAGVVHAQPDPLPEHALARFGTTRFRPSARITELAFSPDGRRLASWGDSNSGGDQFNLWNAGTGGEIRGVATSGHSLFALAWPATGPGVAVLRKGDSFGSATDLMVWDFTAEPPAELTKPVLGPQVGRIVIGGPKAPAGTTYKAAAVSMDGKRLAALTTTGDLPDGVVVFELKPAASLADLKKLATFDAPPAACSTLAFSPDGRWLVGVAGLVKDGKPGPAAKVVVWDVSGKFARTTDTPPTINQGGRFPLAVSDTSAALGLEDGNTLVIQLATGNTRTLETAHKPVTGRGTGTSAAAFTPDGKTLITAGREGQIRLTDLGTGKKVRDLGKHRSWPEALAATADGKRVASAGQDGVIHVWDAATGADAVPLNGHASVLWHLATSADGKTVLTEGGDEVIHVWDAAGTERRRIAAGARVLGLALAPDGRHVVATIGDYERPMGSLRVWDVSTGADASPTGFPKALPAGGFQFTPDGRTLVAFAERKLSAWAWPAGTKLWAAETPKPTAQGVNAVNAVAMAPDGRHFVVQGYRSWYREERGLRFGYAADGFVELWEIATGKRVRRLVEGQSVFNRSMFAPDGSLIHSGGGTFPNDRRAGAPAQSRAQLCVVDPLTGRLVREFRPPGRHDIFDSGRAAALSADGKILFLGTGVGEVLAFEMATGSLRTAYPGHRGAVLAMAAPANDVRRVASGSADTTALWWDVGFSARPGVSLSADDRKNLRAALADPDAKTAFGAMTKLAADPAGFLALATSELKPVPPGPTEADVAPHFKNLDAKAFAAREAATAALDKFGEAAVPLARARLEAETSPEARERLTRFIDQHTKPDSDPERLRQGRAVELLEHLGTPEAKELLAKLAKGGPAKLTADAAGAVRRLAAR
jgi:WD40 repeat protein